EDRLAPRDDPRWQGDQGQLLVADVLDPLATEDRHAVRGVELDGLPAWRCELIPENHANIPPHLLDQHQMGALLRDLRGEDPRELRDALRALVELLFFGDPLLGLLLRHRRGNRFPTDEGRGARGQRVEQGFELEGSLAKVARLEEDELIEVD